MDASNNLSILHVCLSRGLREGRRPFPGQGGLGQGEEREATSKTAKGEAPNDG